MGKKQVGDLPGKTIERLSQYRRLLLNRLSSGKLNVFSHELATWLNLTSVQVRRDLMLIGCSGSQSKGYSVNDLVNRIGRIIDHKIAQRIAVVGMGNLGRAITSYFSGKRDKLLIVAVFDNDVTKTDRVISGIPCHHINSLKEKIETEEINIAILTVTPSAAQDVAKLLVESGIKGILNYTSVPISVPQGVFLEEYDMVTSLEKLAYFVNT
jgi:redox-sensing transcriptional repressor